MLFNIYYLKGDNMYKYSISIIFLILIIVNVVIGQSTPYKSSNLLIINNVYNSLQEINLKSDIKTVAVWPIDNRNFTDLSAIDIQDAIIVGINKLNRFSVIDRQKLSVILKEFKLSQTGIFDPEKAKKIGFLKGIDAFFYASITAENNLTIKLLSVKTGLIVWGDNILINPIRMNNIKSIEYDTNVETIAARLTARSIKKFVNDFDIQTIGIYSINIDALSSKNYQYLHHSQVNPLKLKISNFQDKLEVELSKAGSYYISERQKLESLISEHKFNLSYLVDPAYRKNIGKFIGVDALIYGSLIESYGEIYSKYLLKMVDISTGHLIWADYINAIDSSKIQNLLKIRSISKEQIPGLVAANQIVKSLIPFIKNSDKTTVGILPFENNSEFHSESVFTNLLTIELIKSRECFLLDRSSLGLILKEQGYQQTGFVDDNKIIEIGKLFGMDKIIYGRISESSTSNSLNVFIKMTDVNTTVVNYSDYFEGNSYFPANYSIYNEIKKRSQIISYREKMRKNVLSCLGGIAGTTIGYFLIFQSMADGKNPEDDGNPLLSLLGIPIAVYGICTIGSNVDEYFDNRKWISKLEKEIDFRIVTNLNQKGGMLCLRINF